MIIAGFVIDVVTTESHEMASSVTDFPVESGSDFSDNVRPSGRTLSVDGVVSSTPNQPRESTIQDFVDAMISLREKRSPVTIDSERGSLSMMVNTSFSFSTDGGSVVFSSSWKQIDVVRSSSLLIPKTEVIRARKKTKSPARGTLERVIAADLINFRFEQLAKTLSRQWRYNHK
jgi:hypothetical protein